MAIELDAAQKAAVEGIVSDLQAKRKTITLGGYAGTGKSVVIGELVKRTGFQPCAFFGKAANVLRKKGLKEACTVHSLIYKLVVDDNGKPILRNGRPQFRKNRDIAAPGIIIDEASTVNEEMKHDAQSFHKPVIYVGDHGQLTPIGKDPGLMRNPRYRLETIYRSEGTIPAFAHWLRQGKVAKDFPAELNDGSLEIITEQDDAKLMTSDIVLCAFNRTRVKLNQHIRSMIYGSEIPPVAGDRVIILKNDRELGLFNGQTAVLQSIDNEQGIALMESEDFACESLECDIHGVWNQEKPSLLEQNLQELAVLDYGYCITTHKAQGSEYESVYVVEQRCDKLWEHSRWTYTAATRARTKLVWQCK